MSDKKQILLAFFIPLFLAIILGLFGYFFLEPECLGFIENSGTKVCVEYHDTFIAEGEYKFLIFGLCILSLIMPSFAMTRVYQSRRNQLKPRSIIE